MSENDGDRSVELARLLLEDPSDFEGLLPQEKDETLTDLFHLLANAHGATRSPKFKWAYELGIAHLRVEMEERDIEC